MVNHPVSGVFSDELRLAKKDHHMAGEFLNPGLLEEKQVPLLGLGAVTADKDTIETLECLRIGKFRELILAEVVFFEGSKIDAEKLFTQGASLEIAGANLWRQGFIFRAHPLKPRPIVATQGLAPGESHQASTVTLFWIPLGIQLVELHLRDSCKPAAEVLAIIKGMDLGGIGDSVTVQIA